MPRGGGELAPDARTYNKLLRALCCGIPLATALTDGNRIDVNRLTRQRCRW